MCFFLFYIKELGTDSVWFGLAVEEANQLRGTQSRLVIHVENWGHMSTKMYRGLFKCLCLDGH